MPKNTSAISFIFNILLNSSYIDEKDIVILDKNLNPKKYNDNEYILINKKKDTNEEFIANCTLPEKTSNLFNISCFMDNIYDDKSDYFVFNNTEDIIRINDKNISLLNVLDDLKIVNIFKDEGGEEEEEEEEEGKEEEEEGVNPDVDPSGKERPFFSTPAGIVVIIVFSMVISATIVIVPIVIIKTGCCSCCSCCSSCCSCCANCSCSSCFSCCSIY